ncbi:MAG: caspase family protein, partial [Alphaproteobacteria bacterium]
MLLFRGIVAALMVALLTGTALAERRVALVIGNANYLETSDLANPTNDARLMAETLQNVGFEVTWINDVDQLQMKRAMLEFGRELRQGVDASLFYYAGHGIQANGRNYLVPVDAAITDESELDFQAIDINSFLRVMEASSSRVNIVVLDACRNNPFKSNFRSQSRGLAMVDAPKGTYIAYATAPGEVAEDGTTGNSP